MPAESTVPREDAGAKRATEPREELKTPEQETTRALHRVVWALAWPSVVTNLFQTINSIQDRFFVGHLGPDALAAAGLGGQLMFVLFGIAMSISIGTTALVARSKGAGDLPQARMAANQSLWLAIMSSVVCLAIALPIRGLAVHVMRINPSATEMCIQYLSITLLGIPALFLMMVLGSTYRGIGDMVTPLKVTIATNIVHLAGNWLLIFGNWGFPKMGLAGGGLAFAASQYVGAATYLILLRRSSLRGVTRESNSLSMEWARRILKIGIPALWQNMSRIFSLLAFTSVLARSPESTIGVAALTIGMTSESIAFMPGFGFSMAASTLTGQSLGAKNPRRAERAAEVAMHQGVIVMVIMGIVFYVFARPFALLFTHDLQVVDLTVRYLQIAAVAEPFLGLGMILTGALNGAGYTQAPAWASVITMWAVRLPLAYALIWLAHLGAVGAWWAMTTSTVLSGVAAWALFRWGKWKQVKV